MTTVGLFGTCDKNPWRNSFMEEYDKQGIPYFNPMVDNWHAGLVAEEARHLAEDEIILFPVLGWSYGEGSLSELGFGPLRALRQNKNRSFVFLIETEMHERLTDADRCRASLRSRKLLLGHIKMVDAPNIYVVRNLPEMLETSMILYRVHNQLNDLRDCLTA